MKVRVRTVAAASAAFAAGIVVGPLVAAWAQEGGRAETYRLLNLFGDVFERVRAEYVEPINDRDAVENAINGMLTGPRPAHLLPEPAQPTATCRCRRAASSAASASR